MCAQLDGLPNSVESMYKSHKEMKRQRNSFNGLVTDLSLVIVYCGQDGGGEEQEVKQYT